jgi:REP element-mobilizing transposase RayT
MSFTKVYIHYVWSTKNRQPFLSTLEIRQKLWEHIRQNAKEKGIFLLRVNGYKDHCHCLVSLGKEQAIHDVARMMKGESSHWINKGNILGNEKIKFQWQNDYYAVSVGESILDRVKKYIDNQEAHHHKKTFQEEYNEFIEKYGFGK